MAIFTSVSFKKKYLGCNLIAVIAMPSYGDDILIDTCANYSEANAVIKACTKAFKMGVHAQKCRTYNSVKSVGVDDE